MSTKLKAHQKALIAIVVCLTAALLLATGVWAYDTAQKDQVAPGVTVGGVEIGGRSVEDARDVIEQEVVAPLSKPVIVKFNGERYRLTPRELETSADVNGMLDEAIEVTRDGGLVERVTRYVQGSTVDEDVEPRVDYSEEAVGKMHALITNEVEQPGAGKRIQAKVEVTRPEITTKELASTYPTYVTVSQSEYTLRLFKNLKLVKEYPVAVGGGGYYTPTGLHSIQDKQVDPTWNVPTSSWAGDLAGQSIPPGPSNPLKSRWMGIYDGAGIHGTDDTGSIGSAASHGCIRMLIPDVEDLFDRVEVGDPIYIQ